jgi:hypothetical protein
MNTHGKQGTKRTDSKNRAKPNRWAQKIKTVSTFPPPGTFTRPGEEVAKIMARKDVSPLGLGSAIRMVQMFINRSGKNLSARRKRELEKARKILQRMLHEQSEHESG